MQVIQFASPSQRTSFRNHKAIRRMAMGVFWLLFAAPLAICLTGCGSEDVAAGRAGGRPPALVRIGRIEQRNVTPRVTVVGSVVPVRTSVVASGANGLVETFHIEEGDYVRANEPLSELRIKTTDLAIAEARAVLDERQRELDEMEAGSRKEDIDESLAKMKAAEAIMLNMAKKLARSKSLLARGAINQDAYDDAVQNDEGSRQTFRAAKATYDKLVAGPRKEAVDQARRPSRSATESGEVSGSGKNETHYPGAVRWFHCERTHLSRPMAFQGRSRCDVGADGRSGCDCQRPINRTNRLCGCSTTQKSESTASHSEIGRARSRPLSLAVNGKAARAVFPSRYGCGILASP